MTPSSSTVTVTRLLRQAHHAFHIEYRGYLSNHLAHHLLAAYGLGATPERLEAIYAEHARYLEPRIPATDELTSTNWAEYLGQRAAYDDYLQYFDKAIVEHGTVQTMHEYFPRLMPGMLSSATHPLIHLGYGVEFFRDLEKVEGYQDLVTAEGLAYGAHSYLDLSALINPNGRDSARHDASVTASFDESSLFKLLHDLSEDSEWNQVTTEHRFQDRVKQVVTQRASVLHQHIFGILPPGLELTPQLHDAVLRQLYTATVTMYMSRYVAANEMEFFHAHAITSLHATRQLLPMLTRAEDRVRLLRLQIAALLLIYLAQGRGPFDPAAVVKWTQECIVHRGEGWGGIVNEALACHDEHVVKVVYSLREVESIYPNPNNLWFNAANATVERVRVTNDWA